MKKAALIAAAAAVLVFVAGLFPGCGDEAFSGKLDGLELKIAELGSQLDESRAREETASGKLAAAEERNTEAERQIAALRERIDGLEDQTEELERKTENYENGIKYNAAGGFYETEKTGAVYIAQAVGVSGGARNRVVVEYPDDSVEYVLETNYGTFLTGDGAAGSSVRIGRDDSCLLALEDESLPFPDTVYVDVTAVKEGKTVGYGMFECSDRRSSLELWMPVKFAFIVQTEEMQQTVTEAQIKDAISALRQKSW